MATVRNILLISADKDISSLKKLLSKAYNVVRLADAQLANTEMAKGSFNLLLLDVMLPDKEAFKLCIEFRERDKLIPIVFISSISDEQAKINALRAGADDFISKPFNSEELLLKIERLFFKSDVHTKPHIVHFGNSWIDFNALQAEGPQGKKLAMSKLEYDLAKLLIDNENKPLKREYLYKKIWGYDEENMPNSRTLDNFIVFLRRYFEENAAHPKHFVSVRGVGYKFQR